MLEWRLMGNRDFLGFVTLLNSHFVELSKGKIYIFPFDINLSNWKQQLQDI